MTLYLIGGGLIVFFVVALYLLGEGISPGAALRILLAWRFRRGG
jgi:hypothetical protein